MLKSLRILKRFNRHINCHQSLHVNRIFHLNLATASGSFKPKMETKATSSDEPPSEWVSTTTSLLQGLSITTEESSVLIETDSVSVSVEQTLVTTVGIGREVDGGDENESDWSDVEDESEQVTAVPLLSMEEAQQKCDLLICTNEISHVADPADADTNYIYRQMMIEVDTACRETLSSEIRCAGVQWWHRLFEGEQHSFTPPEATKSQFKRVQAREVGDSDLLREGTHSKRYLQGFRSRTKKAVKANQHFELSTSTGYGKFTEKAARAGVGTLIDATMVVAQGLARSTFVLCRPPTHHAVGNETRARGQSPKLLPYGFCHMNAISAAIAVVREKMKSEWGPRAPIVILDVDVHPGNGNEDTWWDDDSVLHINLNEHLIWPGPKHGRPDAVGGDNGIGANLNFPIPREQGNAAYTYTLLKHVIPIIQSFKPKMIFVACGFDPIRGDAYALMNVSPNWFGWLSAELLEANVAPLVFNLEGGYNPRNCGLATREVIAALSMQKKTSDFATMHQSDTCLGDITTYNHRGVDIRNPKPDVQTFIDTCRSEQLSVIAAKTTETKTKT
eukprot:m.163744 g.163744  ORF g.163744 m.163744 type:complete len:561 (+) comp31303_c0_seq1:82-1764(+)